MISRAILFVFFLSVNFISNAQDSDESKIFTRFKVNDSISFVEFHLSFDAKSVQFEKKENGKFQSIVNASIKLTNDDKVYYFEKFNVLSPESEKQNGNNFYINFVKRVVTKNIKFDCEIAIKDNFSEDSAYLMNFEVDNKFKEKGLDFSDIQLLESFEESEDKSDFVKSGFLMNPATSDFYPTSTESIKFYVELYNTNDEFGEDEPFALFTTFRNEKGQLFSKLGKFRRYNSKDRIVVLNELSIKELPSGNYFLLVEVRSKENKLIGFTKKYIQRANTNYKEKNDSIPDESMYNHNFTHNINPDRLKYYMSCLRPITTELEYSTITALVKTGDSTELRNYFFDYWYKKHQKNALKEWSKFKMNIAYVDEKFSCFNKPGYLSERGRVTLKYGKPQKIEDQNTAHDKDMTSNSNEYQIWHYYIANKQKNRLFVFTRTNGGNCDFEMIHSNVKGEHQNHDWINNRNWRDKLNKSSDPYFRNTIDEENYNTY